MDGISYALTAVTTPSVLLAAAGGVLWGILGGALPGLSPSIAMALLLPFTFDMTPLAAIVMLTGIYIGAEYGGSIPAILIRTPGTNAAAATVIDGYAMHQQGRGGEALGLSLVAGTIAGLVGLICLVLLTAPLSALALYFTPPAYFALAIMGLSVIAALSEGSLVKGLIMGIIGLMISTIGTDPLSGVTRFTFGGAELLGGIEYIFVMLGVFAVAELMSKMAEGDDEEGITKSVARVKLPGVKKLWALRGALGIGTGVGIIEGPIPGAGGTVAAFLSYNEAKRWSKTPEQFGHGAEEGVVAPEAANNAVTSSALIPTLTFGIPGSNSMAVLLGGLLIHGIQPGPMLLSTRPDLVYGLFGGLFLSNMFMLIFGLLLLGPAVWLVNRPKPYLTASIFMIVLSGVYSINQSLFDFWVVLLSGVLGYGMKLLKFPVLPLILGVVLGYMIEANYRRSLLLTNGEHRVFFENPLSLGLLLCAGLIIGLAVVSEIRRLRHGRRATQE
ncbi:tripartite tricarboxylate transporter permease [Albidovulum sediminis]|uniref:Tripartite tricarboxylate transporter permease n=1 Tax=Albidovulum sediminis TaxID=3066345 RepID=A0ABT2NRL3_9RHOB|nr:tripartite tricarboxylate transporter permease [Defluviimonas sediminis]MCT8331585.1 tripartite tricarboxylate transporter permease [Defluviimonas sediminis]